MQKKKKKRDTITDNSLLKGVKKHKCRYYRDICKILGHDHYDYEGVEIQYG